MKNHFKNLEGKYQWTEAQHERVRERVLAHVRSTAAPKRASFSFSWIKLAPATMGVMAFVLLGGAGVTAVAAKDSSSHQRLYPVRVMTEKVRTQLTWNDRKKAARAAAYAAERLEELNTLAQAQAAAAGKAKVTAQIAADKRLHGFKQSVFAIHDFSRIAKKQVEVLASEGHEEADELAAELDAVLDATLGIMYTVETSSGADEPIRAVITVSRNRISPLESNVEVMLNRVVVERWPQKIEPTDESTISGVAAKRTDDVQSKSAQQKILRAKGMLRNAGERLEKARGVYGHDAVHSMKEGYLRAEKIIAEAESLLEAGKPLDAYHQADEALRTAAHIRTYAPVGSPRTKVILDESNQLRLHVLPVYENDLMATTTESTQ